MKIVNDLDILEDELVKLYDGFEQTPQTVFHLVKELVASEWKDEKLREEVELQSGMQEFYIEEIQTLREIIEFVKTEKPTDKEFENFVKNLMKKVARKDLDRLKKSKEQTFSMMDNYSNFEN